mmetsp:Transcript_22490/g.29400  ORF Transcript_22490/g.29400 Transcript_22490/m.29400 type:complete len:388 (+) Transcript_22490:27-1190(+)
MSLSSRFTIDSASSAVAGGTVLGLVVLTKMRANGNILGISGIVGGLTKKSAFRAKDVGERICFLLGMLGGGCILASLVPSSLGNPMPALYLLTLKDQIRLAAAGLMVGYGTALGSGCTSGHGICGNSRLSPRSMAATGSFMLAGAIGATLGQTRTWLSEMTSINNIEDSNIINNIISWPPIPSTSFVLASSLAFIFGLSTQTVLYFLTNENDKDKKKSSKNELARMIIDGFCGLAFSIALGIAGMTSQERVASFLDLSSGLKEWDPTLGLVMGGALGLTTPIISMWVKGLHLLPEGKPVTCNEYSLTKIKGKSVDKKILLGSFLFGCGWGLGGLCPGPAMIGLGAQLFSTGVSGNAQPMLLFNAAMVTGWALHHRSVGNTATPDKQP